MPASRDPSVFELTADAYSAARPGYPDELIDFVVGRAGLSGESRLLELGCGPGLATASFADRGYSIVAVDASARMLEHARRRIGANDRVRFVHTLFEDWDAPDAAFDLVYAGMAWHWLEPEGRDARVARCLRPGGAVAILVYWPVEHWQGGEEVYREHWPGYVSSPLRTIDERIEDVRSDLAAGGVLRLDDVIRHPWPTNNDADETVAQLRSWSSLAQQPAATRERILDAIHARVTADGGRVRQEWEHVVLLVRPA